MLVLRGDLLGILSLTDGLRSVWLLIDGLLGLVLVIGRHVDRILSCIVDRESPSLKAFTPLPIWPSTFGTLVCPKEG